MKQNLNEKINNASDSNGLKPTKIRTNINMNLEKISKTTYLSESTIYDDSQLSKDETKYKGLLVVRVPTNERRNGILIRSFHLNGYKFLMENMELSEHLQVYKAADNRNDFYIINKKSDRKHGYVITTRVVLNKKESLTFFINYFEGLESYLPYDYDDSIEDSFYEFIK